MVRDCVLVYGRCGSVVFKMQRLQMEDTVGHQLFMKIIAILKKQAMQSKDWAATGVAPASWEGLALGLT